MSLKWSGGAEKSDLIESVFFSKIKQEQHSRVQSGEVGKIITTTYWRGNLFSKLTLGQDVLKFKEELLLDEEWKFSEIEIEGQKLGAFYRDEEINGRPLRYYYYYTNDALNFSLFSPDPKKLFMIK